MRVPLAVPNLDGREADYLQECVRSTFVSTAGPFVTRFQEQIARVSGTEAASVTCSGTVALQMALEGLGIGRGHLVMVPSLTFIATPNSISHSGATPWLVDCTCDDWTIDLAAARRAIETTTDPTPEGRRHRESGELLAAIMPVMIMGAALDFDAIVEFAREYGIAVVVDAAAAIGATGSGDRPLGATGIDAVCYSFNGNKTITSGGGGAVAAADSALIDRINHLVTTGRVGADYEHDVIAYNFRMTNVEAAIGLAQIERLPAFLDRKRDIYERYVELAERFAFLESFPLSRHGGSVHWFSGVAYRGDDLDVCADFRAHMNERDIDVRPFWKPIHLQPPYRRVPATEMSVTDGLWERIVPLPCSTGITDAELDHVVVSASEFFEQHV